MATSPTAFWDKIADGYAQMPISDEDAYEQKLRKTREYFSKDTRVLEFACGTGSTAIKHAPFVKDIHAIDISKRMIELCEEKLSETNLENVRFEQNTIENLNPVQGTYDVVMGMSILHLLVNKEMVIQKVYDMLAPGGVFITSTICLDETAPWLRFIAPFGRWIGKMPMVRFFGVQELEKSFTDAGFEIEYRWQPSKRAAVFMVARRPNIVALEEIIYS